MIWKTVLVVLAAGAWVVSAGLGEVCLMYGREDIANEVEKKIVDAKQCIDSSFNYIDARKDIADALENGSVSTAIKKHCSKIPKLKGCLNDLFTGAAPCFEPLAEESFDALSNVSRDALDYLCNKDGERLISFYTEGGSECIMEKIYELVKCSESNAPKQFYEREVYCRIFADIQTCFITTLETCSTSIAADMVKSLFAIAEKAHICPIKILYFMGI